MPTQKNQYGWSLAIVNDHIIWNKSKFLPVSEATYKRNEFVVHKEDSVIWMYSDIKM